MNQPLQYLYKYPYLIGCIVVVLVTLLIDHLFMDLDTDEYKKEKIIENRQSSLSSENGRLLKLNLSNVTLPEPPITSQLTQKELLSSAHSTDSETSEVEDLQASHETSSKRKNLKHSHDTKTNSNELDEKYEEFASLKGAKRQLYFYNNSASELSKTIDYLHQCVGVGLASYNGNRLVKLSSANGDKYQDYSKVLRQVSGFKNEYEQALLNTYASNEVLIRLYPKWFDLKLAKLIANKINNQALTQFSGAYMLTGNQLKLTNITINNKSIDANWTLLDNC